MKVLRENSTLSPESEFIKNILIKSLSKNKVNESYLKKENIGKIVEDFNNGELALFPKSDDYVVIAYNPTMEYNESVITIRGCSTKDPDSERNVKIDIPLDKFFDLFSVNSIDD